jgi:hypothetical protein
MRRLNVVVPYRNRETHFRQFVSHVRAYFARDKADRNIPYRVTIVEQEPGLPLNAGALKNIGFSLGNEETDYTCFHDIDYLPVWADYSWVEQPTPILWHGAETRPIAPGRSPARVKLNLEKFFGGVVLVPNDVFLRAGGYSNDYWGWGYEDVDLRTRFDVARIGIGGGKAPSRPSITTVMLLRSTASIRRFPRSTARPTKRIGPDPMLAGGAAYRHWIS